MPLIGFSCSRGILIWSTSSTAVRPLTVLLPLQRSGSWPLCPHCLQGTHTQALLTGPPVLQRRLTVLVYQLNDDEAADDDNFGEEDHVSSFRQALVALPRQHEFCM